MLHNLTTERIEDLKRCYLEIGEYPIYNNLALLLTYVDEDGYEEPYADITVNIMPLKNGLGAVDINNAPWLPEWIEYVGIGVDTKETIKSGYITYPIYKFDLEKIKELQKKGENYAS